MIDPATEDRILRRAIEDGLPTADGLQEVSCPNGNERYEIGELLGRGGMGTVYKTVDRRLKRTVALKLLRSDEPDRLTRFLREAQAQARVDHENVCQVYEVGELEGKPYIAMQYIGGEPLFVAEGEASRPGPLLQQMTVEQKVRVMQRVAEGIQAAHRQGLIHRDIKPSNIMLERTAEGDVKPCVLDFGLAREVASAGVTSLGLTAGTPSFMAPEQARGEAGALDRRTDVYGLGATLFAVLAGKPPFEGPSSLDILVKVTEAEPPRLDQVPEDLATIVAKCLEKDPAARYDSARALAEDLGRYLDGEPVLARRAGLAYRLLKKTRKHRRLVAAGGVVALAFAALVGLSLRAQWRGQARTRLAGVFGQEIKAIESRMRIAQLLPEHDVTPEKRAIRERMDAIEVQVRTIGAAAEGPGQYALGRGHLALKEYEKARGRLERAWKGGYREREVAYALGQTLAALYQKELAAAERIADKGRREQRKHEIERDYRDPALQYLGQSRGLETESPEYAEALVALCEKRYEDAVDKARTAYRKLPSLYEAKLLEAQVYTLLGNDRQGRGEHDAAAEAYGKAKAAYQDAGGIGRSDSSIPEGRCWLARSLMQMELYSGRAALQPYFQEGLLACDQAVRIDAQSAGAHQARAMVLWRMAESEFRQGKDPRPNLAQTLAAGSQALRLAPEDVVTLYAVGMAHTLGGLYEASHGNDPTAGVQEAIRIFDQGLRIDPNSYNIHNARGNDYRMLAEHAIGRGGDPREAIRQAVASHQSALASKPDWDISLANLGFDHLMLARHQLDHGEDPQASVREALEAGRRTLAVNPRYLDGLGEVGEAHLLLAEYRLRLGEDPRASLKESEDALRAMLALNPAHGWALARLATGRWLLARYELAQGRDPAAALRQGRELTRKARQGDPGDADSWLVTALLEIVEARRALAWGATPETALTAARIAAESTLRADPRRAGSLVALADVQRWRAEWHRRQREASAADIASGLESAERALALNPNLALALALRGSLYLERARAEPKNRGILSAKARDSLQEAVAIDRLLIREYGALLDQARRSAG